VVRPPAGAAPLDPPDELDKWGSLRDFVRDRLPESVRGARLDPGVRGALAIAGLALVAAIVAVVLAWTSAAAPVARQPPAAPKVAVPPLSGRASAAPSAAAGVVVDVGGKVRRPGLVTLAAGARVADAVAAAGGVLPGTSTEGMSLARKLVDGEQLLVGEPSAGAPGAGPSGSTGAAGGPVDLNSATIGDLDALPGIGPVLAQRIVDWRTQHGSFTSVDQLREVSGVGDAKFADLSPLVRV
jgi:competence protein ComEA